MKLPRAWGQTSQSARGTHQNEPCRRTRAESSASVRGWVRYDRRSIHNGRSLLICQWWRRYSEYTCSQPTRFSCTKCAEATISCHSDLGGKSAVAACTFSPSGNTKCSRTCPVSSIIKQFQPGFWCWKRLSKSSRSIKHFSMYSSETPFFAFKFGCATSKSVRLKRGSPHPQHTFHNNPQPFRNFPQPHPLRLLTSQHA